MKYQFTPPEKLKAFTLSEVLITLVIIGVISAITLPSIIQSSQDKEFHSKLKKNFSVLQNALRRAQVDEGLIGDNTVIFTPSESNDRHYESAKRLAKYLNVIKVCKNINDTGCGGVYYPIKYATEKDEDLLSYTNPSVVLSDGSIYRINQFNECQHIAHDCVQDSNGNCKKDENGNDIPKDNQINYCALVYIDVNGAKKPNKLGKDVFVFEIYQDSVSVNTWSAYGSKRTKDILTNKI